MDGTGPIMSRKLLEKERTRAEQDHGKMSGENTTMRYLKRRCQGCHPHTQPVPGKVCGCGFAETPCLAWYYASASYAVSS